MQNEATRNHAHNTHNSPKRLPESYSVNCVYGIGRIEKLLYELLSLGVVLSLGVDGLLEYDAPGDVLTDALLGRMRAERDGLLALVEQREERAAVIDHDCGGADTVPEHDRLEPMDGIFCPSCRSTADLIEVLSGLRCLICNREAWRLGDDGSMIRCDWVELTLIEPPALAIYAEVEKRPTKIERSQPGLTLESCL